MVGFQVLDDVTTLRGLIQQAMEMAEARSDFLLTAMLSDCLDVLDRNTRAH